MSVPKCISGAATLYSPRLDMPLTDHSDFRPIHFVGIAGAGMSALAELLQRRGVTVSGCDANSATAADLRRLGIDVSEGHDRAHAEQARALVVSSAIPGNHAELERARELGIPIIRRAEALAEAVSGGEVVAIAGTHGKTTTTVMATEALSSAGREPTGIVGGRVPAWEGNLSAGSERLFVVEADEFDRSFLALSPDVAVVTNVEADHLDIYADLADIRAAFTKFIARARAIVLCADDPGAASLRTSATSDVIRYGVSSRDARLVARDVSPSATGTDFDVILDGERLGRAQLAVPGRHNVLNALAAIGCGLALGAGFGGLSAGLRHFTGVERRFQRLGDANGVTIVDDYAHHPTEISATLAAARQAFRGRRIVLAFQPHLYSRTRDFAREFGAALSGSDVLLLTEIYPAREQPIPGVTSALVAKAVTDAGGTVAWRGPRHELAVALEEMIRDGDVVLTVGAGDITLTGPELLQRMAPVA